MAILEQEILPSTAPVDSGPRRHLFSRQDWRAMADAGVLADQRVELFEGDIIDMAPIGDWHAALTDPLAVMLRSAFGVGFTVRSQVPVALGDEETPSEPQPDIAVVIGSWRDYGTRTPQAADIRLIVEVADSSLSFDRTVKASLYAVAGVPEYWIVNLVDKCLEVYRDPMNGAYSATSVHKSADHATPLHAPTASIAVADCLP